MKLTNRLNLPQPIVDAVRNDGYTKNGADISVTELLSPARFVTLKREHDDEIEEDVADRIYSLSGQLMHGLLERANRTGVAERRLSIKVAGWTISGGMDIHYECGLLQDYKFVTSWKFKGGGVPVEYEQQLNCYAEILRQHGEKVTRLQIVAILRDWSKMRAAREPDYPQAQIAILDVPLWPAEKAQRFLNDRVVLHQQARMSLPECSIEERWAKPDQWAVVKKGRKRALKLHPSEKSAREHVGDNPDFNIELRPATAGERCRFYCSVSKFCTQYQRLIQLQTKDEENEDEV